MKIAKLKKCPLLQRYQIPYGVMVPEAGEAANLLVVSTVAATHIGLSSLRMEPQFMILGEAAGGCVCSQY